MLKLNIPRKRKQRLLAHRSVTLAALNQILSIDFMHDDLVWYRRFRTFKVGDGFNREASVIAIDLNIPAQHVVWVLGRIVAIADISR